MVDWTRLLRNIEEVAEAELSFDTATKEMYVDSTALSRVAFDPDLNDPKIGTLTIQFKDSGSVYEYYQVKARQARYIMSEAPSVGKYYNKKIKWDYTYSRIL